MTEKQFQVIFQILAAEGSKTCRRTPWEERVQWLMVVFLLFTMSKVLVCPLVWDDDVPGLTADVILGSDVMYDPAAVPSLVRLLQQLLQAGGSALGAVAGGADAAGPYCPANTAGSVGSTGRNSNSPAAYLSTTRRHPKTLQLFQECATAAGLLLEELPMEPCQWCGDDRAPPVSFQGLPALQQRDERFVLHRVVAKKSISAHEQ